MDTLRVWAMAVIVGVIGIGLAIRFQVPETSMPAPIPPPPVAVQAHPQGPNFLDDYEHWLRTGDLPAQYPTYTNDPIGAPFK